MGELVRLCVLVYRWIVRSVARTHRGSATKTQTLEPGVPGIAADRTRHIESEHDARRYARGADLCEADPKR